MDFFRHFFKKVADYFIPSQRNVFRPHGLRKAWLIFFLTVILTAEGVFLINIVARQSALDFIAAVLPGEVISFTNQERATNNVAPVVENPLLDAAAQAKANDMAAKGYFAHVGPDGKEPWAWVKAAGYNYQYAGENLAVRYTDSSDVVNAWMASPTHRANIVKPVYTEIGIGIAQGEFQGQPATFVVQYFGTPKTATVVTAPLKIIPLASAATTTGGARVEGTSTAQQAAPASATLATIAELPSSDAPRAPASSWSTIAKGILNNQAQPTSAVLWILAAVAALMVIGLALTFFVHIQIQPTDILIGGTVVAVIAIAFITLNSQSMFVANTSESAAVFGAVPSNTGFIDAVAAEATQ
jgi:hypothetical protein